MAQVEHGEWPSHSSHPLRLPLTSPVRESLLFSKSGRRRRALGQKPKVMLIVPSYTRLEEPAPVASAFEAIGLKTFETMKRAGTPIGLLRIGTSAQRAGYELQIIDSPFAGWDQEQELLKIPEGTLLRYGLTDSQLRARIELFEPDVVGIQCNYTVQWGNARSLADLVRRIDQDIVVVGGGAHMSGDWRNAMADAPVDFIVVNEADRTFVQLLAALTSDFGCPQDIRGIVYRKDGAVTNTNFSLGHKGKSSYISVLPERQSLEMRRTIMPLPDFSLLDMSLYGQRYHSAGERKRKGGAWAQIFSTIGCNVGCDFCYIPMVNGPWRALGIDWFDQHLRDIKRHGVTEVLIEDDHLLHDPLYACEVFDTLRKHDLPWVEEGGLSLFNLILLHEGLDFLRALSEEEQRSRNYRRVIKALEAGLTARALIEKMASSGCYNVYLAVESANEECLGNSNKPRLNVLRQATADIVSLFAENAIQVTGGFMLGFVNPPRQSNEEPYVEGLDQVDRTIDYARYLMGAGMAYANPFIVTPIPGTPMGEFQRQFVVRNYDTGWSHEKATMATSRWSAEDIERMRLKLLVEANGKDRVLAMVERGTWPVDARAGVICAHEGVLARATGM